MCDSMSPYFTNTANNLPAYLGGAGPGHHEQYNGELHSHMMACHESRGPVGPPQLLTYSHQHAHHQPIHYGQQQYPRFPPYDRLEGKHCADGPSQAEQTSPYYNSCAAVTATAPPPTSQGPAASLAPLPQPPQQYECSGRGSITPPSLDGSSGPGQYGSCKMQTSMLTHGDNITPLGHNSPSPHHPQHQIYGSGPVGSPTQNSNSAISSPLYPWMRSQFGKFVNAISTAAIDSDRNIFGNKLAFNSSRDEYFISEFSDTLRILISC